MNAVSPGDGYRIAADLFHEKLRAIVTERTLRQGEWEALWKSSVDEARVKIGKALSEMDA